MEGKEIYSSISTKIHCIKRRGPWKGYIQRYRAGRRFTGSNSVDAMSEQTKIRGRSKITSEESLYFMEDRKMNVTQSVGFKIDFDDWYHMQSAKDKRIIHLLAMGKSPSDVARACDVSPAAITYRRRYYANSWKDYTADRFEGGVA